MGRHREFDEDAVLDAAMKLFWQQGFRGTSVREFVKTTGLAEPRLYNAFGDKRDLFLLALARYKARGLRKVSEIGASDDPLGAIRSFVLTIAKNLARQEDLRGCLITNTLIEMAPHDEEIRQQLRASFAVRTAIFRQAFRAAQLQGQLDQDADVKALARYLVQMLEGLRVIAKSKPGEKSLRDTARFALSLLPVANRTTSISKRLPRAKRPRPFKAASLR